MEQKKFSRSEILSILSEEEKGKKVEEICNEYKITPYTFYEWKEAEFLDNSLKQEKIKERIVLSVLSLFVGSVLTFIIFYWGIPYASSHAGSIAVIAGCFIGFLGIGGIIIYIYRKKIMNFVFGKTKKGSENINESIGVIIDSIISKDLNLLKKELTFWAKKGYRTYSVISLRRWIVLVISSLGIMFAGLLSTVLLWNQNLLIQNQNNRIDQQTMLQEAERRSSLVFLMSNIMDAIDSELRSDINKPNVRDLSDQLIGRIVALSNAMKPYRYLEGDSLADIILSPERGQLLTALVLSDLEYETYDKIFKRANFEYSDMKNVNLRSPYFAYINLHGSNFVNTELVGAYFGNADISQSNFRGADLVPYFQTSDNEFLRVSKLMYDGKFFQLIYGIQTDSIWVSSIPALLNKDDKQFGLKIEFFYDASANNINQTCKQIGIIRFSDNGNHYFEYWRDKNLITREKEFENFVLDPIVTKEVKDCQ